MSRAIREKANSRDSDLIDNCLKRIAAIIVVSVKLIDISQKITEHLFYISVYLNTRDISRYSS